MRSSFELAHAVLLEHFKRDGYPVVFPDGSAVTYVRTIDEAAELVALFQRQEDARGKGERPLL